MGQRIKFEELRRLAVASFRPQAAGGKGVTGHATQEEDAIIALIPARSLDTVLFFSNRGKVYAEKAYQIPDAERNAKGIPLINVLSLAAGEEIHAAAAAPDFAAAKYVVLATRKGKVKRMALSEIASVRPSGVAAIHLDEGDELGWARLTRGHDEIILVTEQGQALRFAEDEIRPTGRAAGGVAGIRLATGDQVAGMDIVEPNGHLLLIAEQGYGKRTPLDRYPPKGRATGGVQTIAKDAIVKIGRLVAARVVQETDDLTFISANGMVLRTKVREVKIAGRATRGVQLMELKPGDRVAAVARLAETELRRTDAPGEDAPDSAPNHQLELALG